MPKKSRPSKRAPVAKRKPRKVPTRVVSPLRKLREALGLAKLELGRRARVSATLISLVEGGTRSLSKETRARIAEALGCSQAALGEVRKATMSGPFMPSARKAAK